MLTKKTELPLAYIRARSIFCSFRRHTRLTIHVKVWSWMRARSRAHHVIIHVFLSLSTKCFPTQRCGVGVWHGWFCVEVFDHCGEHVWTPTSVVPRAGFCAPYLKLKYQEGETMKRRMALLNCILECLVSNPGAVLIEPSFSCFSLQQPGKCRDSASK